MNRARIVAHSRGWQPCIHEDRHLSMSISLTTKIKECAIDLLLVALSVALAVMLAEGLARLVGFKSNFASTQFFRYDSLLGWHLQPDFKGPFQRPQFSTFVTINSHGLRGAEHSYEKPSGKKRILVLGDSFVWGFGVNDDEIFTALMEKDISDVDVVNGGVTAYGTTQELLWLEREGFSYHPDLVVVVMYLNDLSDNVTQIYNGYYRPLMVRNLDGTLRLTGVPCPKGSLKDRFRKWLVRNSALAGITLSGEFRRVLALDDLLFGRGITSAVGQQVDHRNNYASQLTVALMKKIREVTAKHHVRLLVVSVCHGNEPCQDVVGELRREAFQVVSVDEYPGYSREKMVISGDEHWNAAGHRFVAEAIKEYIVSHRHIR